MKVGSLAASVALALLMAPVGTAQAHDWSDWYGFRWKTETIGGLNHDRTPQWRFVDNFPPGDGGRSRTQDGSEAWNGRTTLDFDYSSGSPDYSALEWDAGCSEFSYQENKVGWGGFPGTGFSDGESLAEVKVCVASADLTALFNFRIKANEDAPWYKGTATPGASQADLWSVMSHEFGHAGGRLKGGDGEGHFPVSSSYCEGGADRHTISKATPLGTLGSRYLEQHALTPLRMHIDLMSPHDHHPCEATWRHETGIQP